MRKYILPNVDNTMERLAEKCQVLHDKKKFNYTENSIFHTFYVVSTVSNLKHVFKVLKRFSITPRRVLKKSAVTE